MQKDGSENNDLERLNNLYLSLDQRLTIMENRLNLVQNQITGQYSPEKVPSDQEPEIIQKTEAGKDGSIEYNIGEFGMAWMGNIVLFFGLIFLFQYLQNVGYHLFSVILGFTSVLVVFSASRLMRRSYAYMANLFYFTGHLLLYFMTLRLHFFTKDPLIDNKNAELVLLLIVLAIQTYFSLINKSQVMGGMVLLLLLTTAVISNSTHFLLSMTVIAALLTVYFSTRLGWSKIVILAISLIYLTHFIWLLNNPIMGNKSEGLTSHHYGYLYLYACGLIFSLLAMLPRKETFSDNLLVTSIIWNSLGFTFILVITVLNFFKDDYQKIFAAIALFCLLYSILLQARTKLKIIASIFALYAFMAISVTVYGIYHLPKAYLLLSIQSLLVVSMALWFRSRFIVVMNTFLFLSLLIAYLKGSESIDSINFSFAVVAFVTARIINWKNERLKIKTDFLRNIYLITGFFMILYSLYRSVPDSYVTVSWVLAAILFFVLSILIKNVKYRYVAIAAMIASALHLFIVDMSNVTIGYRVVAFLFLAVIAISLSIYYSKRLKKKKEA